MILRQYQVDALEDVRQAMLAGHRRIVLVAPTGAGKTTIAAEAIKRATARGQYVIFLAHRQELIDQASSRLDDLGIPHGIIKGQNHPRWAPHLKVQVASVPTVARRKMRFPKGLIFVDECHRTNSRSYLDVLELSPESFVIGLTATPVRTDGKGLGDVYSHLVEVATPAELIEQKFLLKPRIFAPERPDLDGIKTSRGDWDTHELELAMDQTKLIGNIVEHWGRLIGRGRRTVLFATSVAHSNHLVNALEGAGARIAHLDAKTPGDDRKDILEDLAAGELDIVSNVGILTEGWDLPLLGAAILARPTQSLSLYLQMVGRIMRTDPGKVDAILLDHAGNVYRHGFPWDPRTWSLDRTREKAQGEAPVKTCLQCYAVVPAGCAVCPECGAGFAPAGREEPTEEPGDLIEVNDDMREELGISRPEPRARTVSGQSISVKILEQRQAYRQWAAEAATNGWSQHYAGSRFQQRYGFWPSRQITEGGSLTAAKTKARRA